jgi:hypothetical protein
VINKIELVLRINEEDVKILPDSASNYWLVAPIPADMKDVKAVKITVERLDESEVEENAELV